MFLQSIPLDQPKNPSFLVLFTSTSQMDFEQTGFHGFIMRERRSDSVIIGLLLKGHFIQVLDLSKEKILPTESRTL